MSRIPPAEGTLRGPWNDWLGRGPIIRKGHEKFHAGLDIFNRGRPVVSPESGRVVHSILKIPKKASIFGKYGPSVVVVYGDSGVYHWLAHVKDPIVNRNQYVNAGQMVAMATTDHVHWECRQILKPYKGAKYWPWTVTIDPIRFLLYRELTALDAIDYVKSHTSGDDWKNPKKRMDVLRRELLTQEGKPVYPIPLKWTKTTKKAILDETFALRLKIAKEQKERTIEIAAGMFAGLSVLAAVLL